VYNAVPITDEERTLDLTDYSREIVAPQTQAVAERMEIKVATKLSTLPFAITDLNAAEADDPFKWSLEAKGRLDQQGTPQAGRKLLVGTNAYNWILQAEQLRLYDPEQARIAFR